MRKIAFFLVMAISSLKVSAQIAANDTLKFATDRKEISVFLNLVHISGLDDVYSGQPVTIFAPDNNAFEKLPAGMLDTLVKPENKQQLTALLNAHIVTGKLTAKQIGQLIRQNNGRTEFTTVAGNKLIARINANRNITLTDENDDVAVISQFDIQHLSAAFFIIDSVMIPKK